MMNLLHAMHTAQKMKFSIKDFFKKCDQIRSFLRIFSHLLKKILNRKLTFLCSVFFEKDPWDYIIYLRIQNEIIVMYCKMASLTHSWSKFSQTNKIIFIHFWINTVLLMQKSFYFHFRKFHLHTIIFTSWKT